MCSQFALQIMADKLSLQYNIKIPENLEEINERFLPYRKAPVIAVNKYQNSILQLSPMLFSLVPAWSKESKVKFATHNARIETVIEKPTWKEPFQSKHCVVPLTSFFESAYEGPEAGNIIEFAKPDKDILFAAGIYDIWREPTNPDNKIFSFSILTTEPTAFILEHGHDRSPIFLSFENAKTWLSMNEPPEDMRQFLLRSNERPDLAVTIDRPMKVGWEKRK